MKVCKYARGHLVPEQRGRLIGKGPLPKEKLMKALGEVSSHCKILVKFWILNLMTKPNKPYDTTSCLGPSI